MWWQERCLRDRYTEAILDTETGTQVCGRDGGTPALQVAGLFESSVQLRDRALPQRDNTLLSALTMQMNGMGAIRENVGDPQVDNLGDARTGVVQDGKKRCIILSAPTRS